MLKLHKMLFPTHHIGEMSALEETVCGTEFEKMNTLIHYWWAQSDTQGIGQRLEKLHMHLPFGLEIPLLGIYPENTPLTTQENTCTRLFTAALFTTAKYWKHPTDPHVGVWSNKLWYIYLIEY